jgi:hypothetical protein
MTGLRRATVVTQISMGNAVTDKANKCPASGEVSLENAIIEQAAKLAKLCAAGAPSDEEFKALKARLIQLSASFRQAKLALTRSAASSSGEWFALESHVKARVAPATKVRSSVKQYFSIALTLTFFIGFGVFLSDKAHGPLLSDLCLIK